MSLFRKAFPESKRLDYIRREHYSIMVSFYKDKKLTLKKADKYIAFLQKIYYDI